MVLKKEIFKKFDGNEAGTLPGKAKVAIQAIMTFLVMNVKGMINLPQIKPYEVELLEMR